MSTQVTAIGMQVKATSDGNLLIAQADDENYRPADSAYATSANLSTSADGQTSYSTVSLRPGSTIDLKNWYAATAAEPTSYAKGTNAEYSEGVNGKNYLTRYVFLKSDQNINVYVSEIKAYGSGVSFGQNTGSSTVGFFYDSLRVGVLYADNEYVIYALDSTGSASGRAVELDTNAQKGKQGTVPAEHFVNGGVRTAANNISTFAYNPESADYNYKEALTAGTAELVKIFIWFEGEDATCYTNNIDLRDVTIDITFADATATNSSSQG